MPASTLSGSSQNGPVVKRQRLDEHGNGQVTARSSEGSRIFSPFRTVGLISPTEVPFTTSTLGKTSFNITTSVGRSLQTYDLKRGLNLIFLTRPQTPETITAATSLKNGQTLAAWGGEGPKARRGVWLFKRGKAIGELETAVGLDENIIQLRVLGTWIIGCCKRQIIVWKASNLEHYTTLSSPLGGVSAFTGHICTMPTYLNKIFAGRSDGSVEIWNVNTGKLIYTILPLSSDYGSVTAMEPTPALSLLAIAYQGGALNIHDVRADQVVIALKTGTGGRFPVNSISFRTDGLGAGDDGRKAGVMATSSAQTGDVTFWDLNGGGRKMSVLRGAHNPPSQSTGASGGVSKIEFLANQAVIVTSGFDNSLKTWIFNETPFNPVPRVLHTRSGHSAPLSVLQFLPSDADGADAGGKWLLSASQDRSLWGWSLRRDGQSTELSQGNIEKKAKKLGALSNGVATTDTRTTLEDLKASRITCMACSLNRDGGMGAIPSAKGIWSTADKYKGKQDTAESGTTGWESVVTGHEGDKMAKTWFWGRKRAGRWVFPTGDGGVVSSVAMSPCGTFALIGSSTGSIDMYNLQSGIRRQRFPPPLTAKQAQKLKVQLEEEEELVPTPYHAPKKFHRGQGKHSKAVTGIAVDNLNRTVISCGADGKVKFWDFTTGLLTHQLDWHPMTSPTSMKFFPSTGLIALACDDSSIRVVDIETRKLIRELWAPNAQVTDFSFSNDGRWVIAATSNAMLRVWDLSTGHLIDAMKLRSVCTALALSNTGEFLATAQEDDVGINIWTNRSLFAHVPTRHISEDEIALIEMPTASGEGGQGLLSAANTLDAEADPSISVPEVATPPIDQLSESLTTLSLIPKSRWQNLLHLDIIRERNKPKEAPQKPEKAPFFLPSLATATPESLVKPVSSGATITNDSTATNTAATSSSTGSVSRITQAALTSSTADAFTTHLSHFARSSNPDPTTLLTHLSTLPPSAADITLRSLTPSELPFFVHALTLRSHQRRDYELVQAWMAVVLRVHGDVLADSEEAIERLREWQGVQLDERQRLGRLTGYCGGVVGYLRSAG